MSTSTGPVLIAHPFLHGMPEERIAVLAAHARTIKVPARTRLFEEGGTADRFWLIQAGQVVLDTVVPGDGRVIIETLGRRDVVGLSWLFPPFRWRFGAVTTQPVQAIEIDAKAIRAACGQDPAFGYEMSSRFIGVALHRLQATRGRLLDQPPQHEA